ncbi:MAG: GNAT family N-acetyltransferase [Actinomycetota bacterium]
MGLGMIDVAAVTDRATPGIRRVLLGAWILRSSLGETGRANSCAPIGDPGADLGDAVDTVERWYAERDRPTIFQLFDDTDVAVRHELDRRGYRSGAVTDVLTCPISDLRVGGGDVAVEVTADMPDLLAEQLRPARAEEMLSTTQPRWFAVASVDGEPVGAGMGVGDGDLVGVFAMRTRPDQQGRGAGQAVLDALVAEGGRRGATTAWLQVEMGNDRAGDWYRRLGFTRISGYRYRAR